MQSQMEHALAAAQQQTQALEHAFQEKRKALENQFTEQEKVLKLHWEEKESQTVASPKTFDCLFATAYFISAYRRAIRSQSFLFRSSVDARVAA